ncbi:hypothetical protein FS749_010653 [Ceratobasidium sp. UAMH 11750]|nr:hypothetical protein FS749_010653 [Ceratobasidium sp. UAMH 11750]
MIPSSLAARTQLFPDELQTHSHRSDCFKDASLALHANCESLDFDSDARIKSAVQMTLCELTTAEHVSVPLECKSITPETSPRMVSQALARSAQHWSSYSGYLREIPQLCTAYRRLHEIDHAKSIYANITLDKMALFSSLEVYHSKLAIREEELEALTKLLGSIATSLGQQSSVIDDSLARIPLRTEEMANEIRNQVAMLLGTMSTSSQLMSQNSLASLEYHLHGAISETQNALSLATKGLSGDVDGLVRSLDAVALSWNSRLVTFNKRLDVMWDETLVRKLALETALENLNTRVSEVAAQVDSQLASAEKLQELTFETSTSIQTTNAQIADASSTLSHELETLRSVTNELHTNLAQIPSLMLGSGWIPNLLGPLSSMVNGLQFPTWQAQLVMHVVGVGASGIQNSLSLLLTFGCALLFVASQAFRFSSRLLNAIARWFSGGKKLSRDKIVERPVVTPRRRVYRRPVSGRSRLSSVLPHYEIGSL